jgi:hypothetical protein
MYYCMFLGRHCPIRKKIRDMVLFLDVEIGQVTRSISFHGTQIVKYYLRGFEIVQVASTISKSDFTIKVGQFRF